MNIHICLLDKILIFLDRLIYKIINIKQTKKYNVGQPILGKAPKIVSNSSL